MIYHVLRKQARVDLIISRAMMMPQSAQPKLLHGRKVIDSTLLSCSDDANRSTVRRCLQHCKHVINDAVLF